MEDTLCWEMKLEVLQADKIAKEAYTGQPK